MKSISLAILILGFNAFADNVAGGGSSGGSSSAGGADMKAACQLAGSFRLTLDSMDNCNCNASNSCTEGSLPSDSGDCSAPAQSGSAKPNVQYKLGARPSLGSSVDPHKAIDCSGFISAGMCRAGTPFMPGQACKDVTTAEMLTDIQGGKSCYKPVTDGKLLPGDIVVYKHSKGSVGHVFAIDRAGKCGDFSVIQAAGGKLGVGISSGSGGSQGDDQGKALEAAKKVSCGGSSSASDKIKIVRFKEDGGKCKLQPKKLKNECKCDVGRMDSSG